jgi:putative ABC transport system permease protein
VSLSLHQDLRYALREIRRHPRASLVPILTLALGIGAATIVFSVVNGVLLRPLPYAEPDRLVNIWNDIGEGAQAQSLPAVSANDWRYYQRHNTSFVDFGAAVGGVELGAMGIVGGAGVTPERVTLGGLSANFLPVLGVQPMLGRGFAPEDDTQGGPRTVILSHGFWLRRFNADSGIVGKSVEIDDVPRTIIGVLPQSFRLLHPAETYMLRDSDVWTPLQLDWNDTGRRNQFTVYTIIGRLKPGVTLAQGQQNLDAIARGLRDVNPEYKTTSLKIRGIPLHQDVVKSVRPGLLVLLAAVGLLVLIACANVANLLLARASSREREIAIRLAVGASRLQIVRQLLVESAVLTAFAGAIGVAIAFAVLWFLAYIQPANIPRLSEIRVDVSVLLFAVGLLLVTALLSGLAPALHAARPSIGNLLAGARVANHGRQPIVRNALIVGEVALSVVLLVGAGLLARSFLHLQAVRPGFVAEGALSFHIALPRGTYQNFDQRRAFATTLLGQLRALPGVTSVGATSNLPLTGQGPTQWYAYESKPEQWQSLHAERLSVAADFLAAAGTRLLAGRLFTDGDHSTAPPVVIIDELIAKAGWPNESPVGKRLQVFAPNSPNPYATVVGVVEHVRSGDLREDGLPQIYWSYAARTSPSMNYVLRSSLPPAQLAAAAQRVVSGINAALPVTNVAPLTQYVRAASAQARFTLVLMQIVGGLAVFLAAVGLYSVVAFVVAQRTREFGIRLALGETPGGLQWWVVRRGMGLVMVSAAVGAGVALLAVGAIQALLYQVNPHDPLIFTGVVVFLLGVGASACYGPARRASRADPLAALRSE